MFQDGSQRGLIIEDGVITYPGGPLDRSPDLVGWVLPERIGIPTTSAWPACRQRRATNLAAPCAERSGPGRSGPVTVRGLGERGEAARP